MLKIGDFSKLSQVSIKALRLYDQMGLLKPTQVDNSTAYRYYSASQLPRLNRILAFKDLGFSLEQILQLLDDKISPIQMRGMLRLKQAELQQHIQGETARLARVEARLKQIEQEDNMPDYEVVLKTIQLIPRLFLGMSTAMLCLVLTGSLRTGRMPIPQEIDLCCIAVLYCAKLQNIIP